MKASILSIPSWINYKIYIAQTLISKSHVRRCCSIKPKSSYDSESLAHSYSILRVNSTKNTLFTQIFDFDIVFFLCQFWHCIFQFVTILTTWPVNQVTCWRGMMTCQFWWRGILTWYADVSKLIFFSTKNTKFSFFSILTLSLIFYFNFDTMFFLFQSNIIYQILFNFVYFPFETV